MIRKLEAPTSAEVSARLEFILNVDIDIDALRLAPISTATFAIGCFQASARIDTLLDNSAERNEAPNLAAIQDAVCRANPVHQVLQWALLANHTASAILDGGSVGAFAIARRMLGIAVLALEDGRALIGEVSPLDRAFLNGLSLLAEFLLYAVEGDRAAQAIRAAELWKFCAVQDARSEPGRVAYFETMVAFATALTAMDLSTPLDVGSSPGMMASLRDPVLVKKLAKDLHTTGNRMAQIGRLHEHDRFLHLGDCLGPIWHNISWSGRWRSAPSTL
jgi:hypothetical protein